jgi:AraC-like DNA-binding protein
MISFSTDDLPAEQRFDHWREARGRALFGVTIELEHEQRLQFSGRFSAVSIGDAVLAEMQASSYRVSRTRADISRVTGDSLCISHQVRGPGWMDVGGDRMHFVADGALAVSHSDLPFAATPKRSDGFLFRTLKIPLASMPAAAEAARRLAPEPIAGSSRLATLIAACFDALADQAQDFLEPAVALRNVAQLALLARGQATAGSPESRVALRSGYFQASRRLVADGLHRPELSPETVATALGISVRQVHTLFEPTGTSFSRTVTAMRVAEARRLLLSAPEATTTQIAFACGFDSLATFYRAFRQAFGMTPGEMRSSAQHP